MELAPHDLTVKLFLQLAVILAACRACGWLGRRVGQTQVVSEMVAGIVLGPSLFGLLAPQAQAWLFPKTLAAGAGGVHPSMLILYAISQLGLVLFMFMVGLEFNHRLIMGRVRHASLVSGAGIVVPLALGAGAAYALRGHADLFAPHVTPGAAALYLGAAMSITALPTLARLLHEKGIARTRMGTLLLAAGSSGDAAAWCLLALVLSYLEGSRLIAILAIGGGGLYVAVMLLLGRPLLRVLDRRVMVLMAIITTLMASPLFEVIYGRRVDALARGEQPA
jgi:Kef-type K+ transport system membrane component KefB